MLVDCAFASDGGSIWLGFGENKVGAGYTLNRKIASRGTPQFEEIADERGTLSMGDRAMLLRKLRLLRPTLGDEHPALLAVDEFLKILGKDEVLPSRLRDLYSVAEIAAAQYGLSAEGVFDPCGLLLEDPPSADCYAWCTPKTALTFARTGGDGVHYSYLVLQGLPEPVIPIVMTMPAVAQNFVVAESFDEFFGLGYHVGWFALEQIAYRSAEVEAYFAQPDCDDGPAKTARMTLLRERLAIQHVRLLRERVESLTQRYAEHLVVPDDPEMLSQKSAPR